jgi:hypothetical protein
MWDGEHFTALFRTQGTYLLRFACALYACILGNRLPQRIIDKLTDDLCDRDRFYSPWGLASEDMTSDYFCPSPGSIGRGCIIPPTILYIITGLWETSRRADARLFAENYLNALRNKVFPFSSTRKQAPAAAISEEAGRAALMP